MACKSCGGAKKEEKKTAAKKAAAKNCSQEVVATDLPGKVGQRPLEAY